MEVVYKKKVLDKIKEVLSEIYEQQGSSGIEGIDYIQVTRQEMDEIRFGSGFTKVNEFEKQFLIPYGLSRTILSVKLKVVE